MTPAGNNRRILVGTLAAGIVGMRAGWASAQAGQPLRLGFSSHGHFTSAFHAECGVTPSAFRQTATSSRLRELSRNLEV